MFRCHSKVAHVCPTSSFYIILQSTSFYIILHNSTSSSSSASSSLITMFIITILVVLLLLPVSKPQCSPPEKKQAHTWFMYKQMSVWSKNIYCIYICIHVFVYIYENTLLLLRIIIIIHYMFAAENKNDIHNRRSEFDTSDRLLTPTSPMRCRALGNKACRHRFLGRYKSFQKLSPKKSSIYLPSGYLT